jgi:16S rRNA (adenine1518-N6/adenine1519-N6)-dimethyltransferase
MSIEPETPAAALRDLGVRPSKRLSQSFLRSPAVADVMVRSAGLAPTSTVLEIGPGLGILTGRLVRAAGRVVAIEVDRALAEALPRALSFPPTLRVVQGDALAVDLGELVQEPYTVVASLPYHIATAVLFRLAFQSPRPDRVVAMLQREVATRVAPPPGRLTYLGAALATVAEARILRQVPPGAFFPRPKVRSAVVRLDFRPEPLVPFERLDGFVAFLRAGFAQPRRQLHNSLALGLGVSGASIASAATRAGIDSTCRPGQLSLEDWIRLDPIVGGLEFIPSPLGGRGKGEG